MELVQKFSTLPKGDAEDKTVECCGVSDQVCYKVANLNENVCRYRLATTMILEITMTNHIIRKRCSQRRCVRFVQVCIVLVRFELTIDFEIF